MTERDPSGVTAAALGLELAQFMQTWRQMNAERDPDFRDEEWVAVMAAADAFEAAVQAMADSGLEYALLPLQVFVDIGVDFLGSLIGNVYDEPTAYVAGEAQAGRFRDKILSRIFDANNSAKGTA